MALGLSVIFGVVRVVNFAHGEMMTIAMYAATVLFAAFKLDPFLAMLPIAAAFFVFGYALQAGLINPFITRPEHSQFMLLVAVAIIMVNALLMIFGPDARNVQTEYQLESWEFGPILFDKSRFYAAAAALVATAALFAFFRVTLTGKAIRACADNHLGAQVVGLNVKHLYALTFGLGSACLAVAGCAMVMLVEVTPALGPAYTLLAFVIVIVGGLGSMPGALLCGGRAVLSFRRRALGGTLARDPAMRAARHADRLPRLPLQHLGRVFRAADHRLRRIHAHRLRPHRLVRRPGRPVHQGGAARPDRPAQLPRPAGDVLLRHARACRRRLCLLFFSSQVESGLLLAGHSGKRGSRAGARHQYLPLENAGGGGQRRHDRRGRGVLRLLLQQPLPR